MKKQLKSFSIRKMTWLSAGMLLISAVPASVVNLLVCGGSFLDAPYIYVPAVIVGYFIMIFVHEAFHALSAVIFAKTKIKDIQFGFVKEQMMFYCHVKTPLTATQYRIVLLTPLIFTGLIPLVVSTIWGNPYLILLFSLLVAGAAGDVIMFCETLRYTSSQLIEDHPKAPAYYLVYEDDELPEGFSEVTPEQEETLMNTLYKTKK